MIQRIKYLVLWLEELFPTGVKSTMYLVNAEILETQSRREIREQSPDGTTTNTATLLCLGASWNFFVKTVGPRLDEIAETEYSRGPGDSVFVNFRLSGDIREFHVWLGLQDDGEGLILRRVIDAYDACTGSI